MEYLILDLETTIKKSFKRTANPLDRDNRIIAIGTKIAGQMAHGEYVDWGLRDGPGVQDFEITKDIIVGHNIKFDLLYLWKYKGIQEFIQRGGKIWDTQLAEYYLTGQQTRWYDCSLRDLAVSKYGCPERTKFMEEYWEKGTCTSKIPKEIVLEDVCNDVLDTEQIYLNQLSKIKALNMLPLIETVMNELLVTTEMEFHGMYIDKEVLDNNKLELEFQLSKVENEFNELVKRYWKCL